MAQSNEPTIEQMNDVIAVSDGWIKFGNLYKKEGKVYAIGDFKYHTSWDCLMPVVEKIRGMGYHIEITISVDCSVEILKLRGDPEKDVLRIIAYSTPINAVYTSVYQFITWYNQQPQTNGQNNAV